MREAMHDRRKHVFYGAHLQRDQCQLFQQCLDCTHLKSFRQGLWTDDGLLTDSDSPIGPTEQITRTAMQMQGRHIDLIPIDDKAMRAYLWA